MTKKKSVDFDDLPEDQKEIARNMGYQGMFSKRDTAQQCYDYVTGIDDPRAIIALALLQNTLAIHVAQNYTPKE